MAINFHGEEKLSQSSPFNEKRVVCYQRKCLYISSSEEVETTTQEKEVPNSQEVTTVT